ncbi:ABC transporter substrate-binding protein [Candidatus Uhrbacteria bacterium]|nr:ABC transporter substrate-binding protein [Candidatus Uhrbacteria bacterium]
MNERQKFSIVVLGVLVFLAGYLVGKNANQLAGESSGALKIGFIGPLSGDTANLGENMRLAVELAADEINTKGGVNGKNIEVVFEDGKCDGKEAVNAGNKLLNIDKVTAIIGGVCSSETLAVAPLAEKANVPLVSAASTNPKITDAGEYTFRFVPSDSFQGNFTAEHFVNNLKKKNVGVLYCKSDYCVGIKDAFKKRLSELGGKVVAEEGFEKDSRDLRSQIAKVKAAKPEIVYFVSYTEGTIVGLKQMKNLGVIAPVFGADAWDDPKIGEDLKAVANGAQYSLPANQSLPKEFVDSMSEKTGGKELVVYAPRAYDIVYALVEIAKKSGATSAGLETGLKALTEWKGISDTYSLDENGDVKTAKYTIKEFKDGKAVEKQ